MNVKKYTVSMFTKNRIILWDTRSLKIARFLMNRKVWKYAKITEIYDDGSVGHCIDFKDSRASE